MNKHVKEVLDHHQADSRKAMLVLSFSLVCSSYAFASHSWTLSSARPTETVSVSRESPGKERTIKGNVKDEHGEPVIGATVKVRGQQGGTITDIDGNFVISSTANKVVLDISYIGYKNYTKEVMPGTSSVEIKLEPENATLQEVLVVGYGTQKKETVTGAISMVQTKELTQSPQANISNLLTGRMPGLLSVQRSGEPGADATTLRIRGVGTFAGGDAADPLVMVDGIETSDYNSIDPNEIESVSILKDASSTAVYGVRGANGVLLITTKRGEKGKPKLSYSGNIGMTKFTELRENMRSYEYAQAYNEARKYDSYISGSYTPMFSEKDLEMYRTGADPIFYPDVDWYDLMLKDHALTTQHNVSISGGVDKVRYFASLGYYNQEGLFAPTKLVEGYDVQSGYERYNFRSNLDFNINKYLSIKMNIASQMGTRKGSGEQGRTTRVMEAIAKANPMSTLGIIDGKIISLPTTVNNPLQALYETGYRKDYRNHLTASVGFNLKIPKVEGLSLKGTVSYENYYQQIQKFEKNPFIKYFIRRNKDGELIFQPSAPENVFTSSTNYSRNRRIYVELGVNYDFTLWKNHNFTTLLLYNQTKRHVPYAKYNVPYAYQGIVGRLTYDYKSRYMFEFNMGYNGTENFAKGNRFGFFPAFSGGWTISEEQFFPKSNVVTYLKVRGSYGEVGNDKIGGERFLYLPTAFVSDRAYHLGDINNNGTTYNTVSEGIIGNPDVTWERAKKTNIGLEASFWNNHIRLNADYFVEKRDNILAKRNTMPVLFGGSPSAMNLGRMKNSGFDGDIMFRGYTKDFNYWVKANLTYAHNKIEFMDEVKNQWPYKNKTGLRLDQYFGLVCDGFYNTWEEVNSPNRPKSSWNNNRIQPGDLKYRDINGDGVIDWDDTVPIGYSNFPEITYGFSFGGDWKGIDLSVLFQGVSNVSLQLSRLYMYGFTQNFSAPVNLRESWSQERYEQSLPISYPHLAEGDAIQKHNYQTSSFWVRDASYLRLKNIEIGYTLPKKWMAKLHMSSVRLYVNGTNLFTWTDLPKGIDPENPNLGENNEPYPLTKIYNFGMKINF